MRRIYTPLTLLTLLLLLLPSCQSKKATPPKPTVVVSVPPYISFVKKIAHDHFEVRSLVPTGTDPHTYEPLPLEVERIQNPVLWVKLGEAFDQKVARVFQQRKEKLKIIDITEGFELLSYCHHGVFGTEEEECSHSHAEGRDLHVWMSVRLAEIQARHIADALSQLFPEKAAFFEQNLALFLQELRDLDQEISHMLTPLYGKAILVSHPAFGYFCQDYGLIQLSVEMDGKEPLPQHITEILDQAKQYQVTSVIIEPQSNNKGAELIARQLRLSTHQIDPYSEHYTDNLRTFAKLLID